MATTGYPGKKETKGVGGGVTQEYADYTAGLQVTEAMTDHELKADPHPQYTTNAEVLALIPPPPAPPSFVTYWKWS